MKIEQIGFGEFTATNGKDSIKAKYERGKRGDDGKIHPHWNLQIGSKTETVFMDKEKVTEYVTTLLTAPLKQPLERAAAEEIQKEDGVVHGIVLMDISEFVDNDEEGFLNLLIGKLCQESLCDIKYFIVAVGGDGETLNVRVEGKLAFAD